MIAKITTLKEVGEMLTYIVENMATKDGLDSFRSETAENFGAVRTEIAHIRRDLEDLRSRVDNMSGYSKEIDHALARIARIEKRLGIDTQLAA